ncbi:MAG: hypothetical protein JNK95_08220 [Candidatus Competibacter sp.]|nr:hypothetical protein [Candidatus Competibacter sp.]MDG4607250.1 hypothetical protein [Candidatus Contendobacter sp.]
MPCARPPLAYTSPADVKAAGPVWQPEPTQAHLRPLATPAHFLRPRVRHWRIVEGNRKVGRLLSPVLPSLPDPSPSLGGKSSGGSNLHSGVPS